jgi:hypothetical protein
MGYNQKAKYECCQYKDESLTLIRYVAPASPPMAYSIEDAESEAG